MNSTLALARAEIRRLGRNKRYSIFSVGLPVVLYLVVARSVQHYDVYGVAYAAYYMIAMASVGAFSSALTGNAVPSPASRPDLVEIGPLGVASHYGWPKIRIVDLGGG